MFNYYLKSRDKLEIQKRVDYLVKVLEREFQNLDLTSNTSKEKEPLPLSNNNSNINLNNLNNTINVLMPQNVEENERKRKCVEELLQNELVPEKKSKHK
jgi:hypothetical protein